MKIKRLILLILAALLCLGCAHGEALDTALYAGYTGEAVEGSAEYIQALLAVNNSGERAKATGALTLETTVWRDGLPVSQEAETLCWADGVYVDIPDSGRDAARVFIASGESYMIQEGMIYTMPTTELLGHELAPADMLFVYDPEEVVLGLREWDGGSAILARAGEQWMEYFVDGDMRISEIRVYLALDGGETPELVQSIRAEDAAALEIPSFILRAQKAKR